jgi:peptidylprolyl isomerase
VVVTAVEEDTITIDANHPLAGKELVFDIELVEIA